MAVFAVFSASQNVVLGTNISTVYPQDHIQFSPTVWIVSDAQITTAQVCAKLGIGNGGITNAVVVHFDSYFGHATNALWEWLKLKGVYP